MVLLHLISKLILHFKYRHHKKLSFEEFRKKMLNQDATILDVRDKKEFDNGHLPGAVWIDFKEVENQHKNIKAGHSDEIVVFCNYGPKSVVCAQKLMNLGYKNVYSINGGIKSHENKIRELYENI